VNTPSRQLASSAIGSAVAGFLIDAGGVDEGCLSGVCVIAIDQMLVDVPSPRRFQAIALHRRRKPYKLVEAIRLLCPELSAPRFLERQLQLFSETLVRHRHCGLQILRE
jgi:hypothetical protein